MENNKKVIAAITAVSNYIKTEEEMMLMQNIEAPQLEPVHSTPVKVWGISSRLTIMQLRNQMQLKAFHGAGLR